MCALCLVRISTSSKQTTREALVRKKAEGVQFGRRVLLPPATDALIRRYRAAELTQTALADRLNDEGVSTAAGAGRWSQVAASRILRRDAFPPI